MVNRDSLRKRAASQSTESPQVTKRNTTAPLHVGLRTILARCPLQPLSSGEEEEDEDENKDEEEEEDEDENKDEEEEEDEEAQELDKDLD